MKKILSISSLINAFVRSKHFHLVKDKDVKIEPEEEAFNQKSHDCKDNFDGSESAIDIEVNMISIKRMNY